MEVALFRVLFLGILAGRCQDVPPGGNVFCRSTVMDSKVIEVRQLRKEYFFGKFEKTKYRLVDTLLFPYRMLRNDVGPFLACNNKRFWALKDVSFDVRRGEKVGIIGKNGAGKSTLLKILSRLVYPTEGEARIRGRVTSLLEIGTGFNKNLTGRENIFLNATLYGLSRSEIKERFDEMVEFSGVGKFLDTKIKYYSSGMYMRLAFSVAAHLDPDILMLDEVLAVGDLAFQQKCLNRVEGLASGGRTILFVSHSMGDILKFCERVIWLEDGKIRFDGNAAEGVKLYQDEQVQQQRIDLETRADRTGTGTVRFTKVSILDQNMNACESVRTGDDISIALDYACIEKLTNPPSDVFVCIVVEDDKQQRLFGLPSEVLHTDFSNMGPRGQFICKVKRLPIIPGVYDITMSLLVDRQVVDKVTRAHKLIVLDGDYYGTKKLPLSYFGRVCVDFDWSHKKV